MAAPHGTRGRGDSPLPGAQRSVPSPLRPCRLPPVWRCIWGSHHTVRPSVHPSTHRWLCQCHGAAQRGRHPREAMGGDTLPDPHHHQTDLCQKRGQGSPTTPTPRGARCSSTQVLLAEACLGAGAVIWERAQLRGLRRGPLVPRTRQQRQRHARPPPPPPPAPRALERFSLRNLSSSSVPGQQAFKLFC